MHVLFTRSPRQIGLRADHHTLLLLQSAGLQVQVRLVPNDECKGMTRLRDPCGGVLGLVLVEGHTFVALVLGASRVAEPQKGQSVRRILSTAFVCIDLAQWDRNRDELADAEPSPCAQLEKLLGDGSFHYASGIDITRNTQQQATRLAQDPVDLDLPFVWNLYMLEPLHLYVLRLGPELVVAATQANFLVPVIRGFAETVKTNLHTLPATMTLIARQLCRRAGTRFNTRGIDDGGHVANYVESEMVLALDAVVYLHVQLRGSVPVFWEQDTTLLNPKVSITRSRDATQPMFNRHFDRVGLVYGPVACVDLLLATKQGERELSTRYRQHIEVYNGSDRPLMAPVEYVHFDFHAETTGANFQNASRVLPKLRAFLETGGYLTTTPGDAAPRSVQRGVFRTNCLDCLDRTNFIQQVILGAALELFMTDHRVDPKGQLVAALWQKHQTLWADHGDRLLQMYTGTNALKSSFTRLGKMSLAGALLDMTKSVQRVYINNYVDKGRQAAIDELLGQAASQTPVVVHDPVQERVAALLLEHKLQFTRLGSATVYTATFNVNGLQGDILAVLQQAVPGLTPDIVAVGFQELVDLLPGSIIGGGASTTKMSSWEAAVAEALAATGLHYTHLRTEVCVLMGLVVFCRNLLLQLVREVHGSGKKTGFGGAVGNKGGCAVRLDFGVTLVCLVTCHLAAGTDAVVERGNDYAAIVSGLRFPRGRTIESHDCVVWMGDVNYRVALESAEARACVASGDLQTLRANDQLVNEMRMKGAFFGYREGAITFPPTYKYDRDLLVYDLLEKQRTPLWTDRVLFKGAAMRQVAYGSVADVRWSDHRPVYAVFAVDVEFVDVATKLALAQRYYDECSRMQPGSSTAVVAPVAVPSAKPAPPAPRSAALSPSLIDMDGREPELRWQSMSPSAPEAKPQPPQPRKAAGSSLPALVPTGSSLPALVPASPSPSASARTPPPVPNPRNAATASVSPAPSGSPAPTASGPPPPAVPKKPAALSINDWTPLVPK